MFGRGPTYGDVSRCPECPENIPLLMSLITAMDSLRYECGHCGTELEISRSSSSASRSEDSASGA
jgi:hypothetical protein